MNIYLLIVVSTLLFYNSSPIVAAENDPQEENQTITYNFILKENYLPNLEPGKGLTQCMNDVASNVEDKKYRPLANLNRFLYGKNHTRELIISIINKIQQGDLSPSLAESNQLYGIKEKFPIQRRKHFRNILSLPTHMIAYLLNNRYIARTIETKTSKETLPSTILYDYCIDKNKSNLYEKLILLNVDIVQKNSDGIDAIDLCTIMQNNSKKAPKDWKWLESLPRCQSTIEWLIPGAIGDILKKNIKKPLYLSEPYESIMGDVCLCKPYLPYLQEEFKNNRFLRNYIKETFDITITTRDDVDKLLEHNWIPLDFILDSIRTEDDKNILHTIVQCNPQGLSEYLSSLLSKEIKVCNEVLFPHEEIKDLDFIVVEIEKEDEELNKINTVQSAISNIVFLLENNAHCKAEEEKSLLQKIDLKLRTYISKNNISPEDPLFLLSEKLNSVCIKEMGSKIHALLGELSTATSNILLGFWSYKKNYF